MTMPFLNEHREGSTAILEDILHLFCLCRYHLLRSLNVFVEIPSPKAWIARSDIWPLQKHLIKSFVLR